MIASGAARGAISRSKPHDTQDLRKHAASSSPAATKVVQGEGTSVFKVSGKMFAICGGFAARSGGYMFKVSNMA